MKLEKREITLNEKDSVADMLYMEKFLLQIYENYEIKTEIKELQAFCKAKADEARTEIGRLEKEMKKIVMLRKKSENS